MVLSKRHLSISMQLRKTVLEEPDWVTPKPCYIEAQSPTMDPTEVISPSSPFLGTVLNATTLPPFPRGNSQELKLGDLILPVVWMISWMEKQRTGNRERQYVNELKHGAEEPRMKMRTKTLGLSHSLGAWCKVVRCPLQKRPEVHAREGGEKTTLFCRRM